MLIECLAGIRKPDSGEIWIDGRNVTEKFPEERHIGYLPQDFALFPTMTVEENIAFGLKARKKEKKQIRSKVEELANVLGVSGLLSRSIQGLSGGEKQRVALARALATEPKVVFLDEPLSALDEETREKLAAELRNIHDRFRTTFVHISHNFEEVAQIADRVALMNRGAIEQVGPVNEILKYPVSRYAAEFTRTRNIFEGTAEVTPDGLTRVFLGNDLSLHSSAKHAGKVFAAIRPEAIRVGESPFENTGNSFMGRVLKSYNKGIFTMMDIDIGILISAYSPHREIEESLRRKNGVVSIQIPPDSVHLISR
jgi:ABC-type Fe3+/spermidine/putrescine transport system ATPase subunit